MVPDGPVVIENIRQCHFYYLNLYSLVHDISRKVRGQHTIGLKKTCRHRTTLWTHSGYVAPSERSKRDDAMEFSDSRLWESYRRMFAGEAMEFSDSKLWESYRRMCDVEEGGGQVSSEPFRVSAAEAGDEAWAGGLVWWESAGEEDVVAEGVDTGALAPLLVGGICRLSCGGGLTIILDGGFSTARICYGIEKMANVSDTM